MTPHWQTETDAAAVADTAYRLIGAAARSAIADRGRFSLVLAGGSTPLATYARLAASDQQWQSWSLFYGDERCLPTDHPQRNSRLVAETGLAAHVAEHFPIAAELGAAEGAARYRRQIAPARPFDMVLLGMGEDGHTASLFPGQHWPEQSVFAVSDAPKPPAQRVTLGIAALQDCRRLLVLVTGERKADAVRRWRHGADLPVARVSAVDHALVLVERKCLDFAGGQAPAPAKSLESGQ